MSLFYNNQFQIFNVVTNRETLPELIKLEM